MGALLVCPECAHEWNPSDVVEEVSRIIKDASGDHDIEAKVDGFGPMNLKSSIVRKA